MIFVTVGTHEQQFNRLIQAIDELADINEHQVIMQTGYCTYSPVKAVSKKIFSYEDMKKHISKADIVITHGGPASFIMALQVGKIPIVVPRRKKFNEHVNDHQVEFVKLVHQRFGNIIPIYDTNNLKDTIENYRSIIREIPSVLLSNNQKFNRDFSEIINKLYGE